MRKTNEVIGMWRQQLAKPMNITFNIQIDTKDFNEMVREIEEQNEKVARLERGIRKAILQIDLCFSDESDADTALNYAFNELKKALK